MTWGATRYAVLLALNMSGCRVAPSTAQSPQIDDGIVESGENTDGGLLEPGVRVLDETVVLDAPSPQNFWLAATQDNPLYEPFEGYGFLEMESELVVVGTAVELTKGAVWNFEYPEASREALGPGHRNTTVMQVQVEYMIKGDETDYIYVSFGTGTMHGEFADIPEGRFKFYIEPVQWLDNQEFDDPYRGVPDGGTGPLRVLRPEGLVGEDDSGEFSSKTPLTEHYDLDVSVYAWET